ncbi:MAG: hypothetical protein GDA49_05235 [Rhodospirillales bacterium]|nr:hypothetical protein [Rhodospirillales bacterium]
MRVFAGWLYVLGGVSAVFGAALCFAHIPNVPSEDQLEWYEGFLRGIRLEKDFDGTDIVYFIYRDHDKRYRYVSRYPQYVEVRDRLGINRQVDILVEIDGKPGLDGAYDVWGLVEHDPLHEGTVVTYQDIHDEVTETDRSWQAVGMYGFGGGVLAILLGYGIRRAVPHVPKDPTA